MNRRNAAAVLPLLAALLTSPARAATFLSETAQYGQGGNTGSGATLANAPSVQEVGIATQTSSSFGNRAGFNADLPFPRRISDLAVASRHVSSVTLEWTAPLADSERSTGTVAKYLIRFSSMGSISSDADFSSATVFENSFIPLPPGGLKESRWVTGLGPGATYYFAVESANEHSVRSGRSIEASTATLAALPPGNPRVFSVSLSSITVAYDSVGSGGYVVQASTASDFTGVVTSSSTSEPSVSALAPQGLHPNTTYFLRAGAVWSTTTTYANTSPPSTSTLANLVAGTQVFQVNLTSITINWAPLPSSPPDASSKTAEGYLLQASTAADFTGTIYSSATPNVALSTLTITGLAGNATYYFRAGSLNWNDTPNYAPSTYTKLETYLSISISSDDINLGTLLLRNDVALTTSTLVTNAGNVGETYSFRATTVTAGSPWRIAAAPGTDQFSLWTVINSTQAALVDFDPADRLSETNATATGSAFTMGNQTGVAVPTGDGRTLWFRLALPNASSTTNPQDIRITITAEAAP